MKLLRLFEKRPAATADAAVRVPSASASNEKPAHWSRLRRQQLPHELVLSGWTRNWLMALPEPVRPAHLGERHPHIANSLALCWRDPMLTARVFDDLLIDRRFGRQGFAPDVRAELVRLREFHEAGRVEPTIPAMSESLHRS